MNMVIQFKSWAKLFPFHFHANALGKKHESIASTTTLALVRQLVLKKENSKSKSAITKSVHRSGIILEAIMILFSLSVYYHLRWVGDDCQVHPEYKYHSISVKLKKKNENSLSHYRKCWKF